MSMHSILPQPYKFANAKDSIMNEWDAHRVKFERMTSYNPFHFASNIVENYKTFDYQDEFYKIDIDDVPDFTQNKFASILMCKDFDKACEATNCDNEEFATKMLPALINYLKNSTDRDAEIAFVNAWREGVTKYFKPQMEELLENEIY